MLTTFTIIISMIIGILIGRWSVDTKKVTITRAPDIERLEYLEATEQSAFYNDQAQAWAVLQPDGKPIKAARSLRSAIDFAKGRSNG